MLYGILVWSRGMETVLGKRLSAWTERMPAPSSGIFLAGIISGICLHGYHGFHYIRRRYLAGLLTAPAVAPFALGMTIGIFLPATAMLHLPASGAYILLLVGILLQLGSRNPTWQQSGMALIGLGICWLGFVFCRQAPPAFPLAWIALAIATLIAVSLRTPAPLMLATVSLPPHPALPMPFLPTYIVVLALCWISLLALALRRTKRPFTPPMCALRAADTPYPERALQAVLQELRRTTQSMAQAANNMLQLQDKKSTSLAALALFRNIEHALDEEKPAAQRYLLRLSRYALHKRQARLLLYLFTNISDAERISDHLYAIARHLHNLQRTPSLPRPVETDLTALLRETTHMIDALAHSITANRTAPPGSAENVLEQRDDTLHILDRFTATLQDHILQKQIAPATAIQLQELHSHLERLIRHIRAIAISSEQQDYWIEPDCIHERARLMRHAPTPPTLTTAQIRQRLAEENVSA